MIKMLTDEEMRNKVIRELSLEGLDEKIQNKVITEVTAALFDRGMIALLKAAPKEDIVALTKEENFSDEKQAEVFELLTKKIPNAKDIINTAMREGLQAYKEKFLELVQKEK